MVITHSGGDAVTIKTKAETITVGPGVTIGDYRIPGAGEFDIASVQCEGVALGESVAYFIRAEDLVLLVLEKLEVAVTKVDDASKTHILVADIRSDDTADSLKSIVKAIEPSYVILAGAGATPEFIAALGIPPVDGSTLKITRAGLPLEGTSVLARS